MATLKSFFVLLMLALQLVCSGFPAHALLPSDDSFSDPDITVIPHQFMVWLADDYTLDSHWRRIGVELNITHYLKNIGCYFIVFDDDTIVHNLSEESTLALIRSDPNVDNISRSITFKMEMGVVHGASSRTKEEIEAMNAGPVIRVVKEPGIPMNSTRFNNSKIGNNNNKDFGGI